MSPAHRKIKLLSVKLSSLTAELKISREIFKTASGEIESIFDEKYSLPRSALEETEENPKSQEQTNKEVAQPTSGDNKHAGPRPGDLNRDRIASDKIKDPEVKKLFKKIASKIHPDKLALLEGEEKEKKEKLFRKAVSAMEEGDLVLLADVAMDLKIEVPVIPALRIKQTEEKIKTIKKEISMIESTMVWKWFFSEDEEKKKNILERLLKILHEKNPRT